MAEKKKIEIRLVRDWEAGPVIALYRAGGWWREGADPGQISRIISGSFAFAVGVDTGTGETVAMGRVISDGCSDAYIQDLIVLPEHRNSGIGKKILEVLVSICKKNRIAWIGLIAEPGTERFYTPAGFSRMEDHVPMLYRDEGQRSR